MGRKVRITLERRVTAADDGTGLDESFVEVAEVLAHVGGVAGAVNIGEAQIATEHTHRAVLRWVDPTTFTHFSRNGERFRVRTTRDPDLRRKWLEVTAEQLAMEPAA